MSIFKEISKEEYFLKKNSTQFKNLSNEIATKVGGVLRDVLNQNITESSEENIDKVSYSRYLNEYSEKYTYKLGLAIGDSDFLTVIFDVQFLRTCAHFWLGGSGVSGTSPRGDASIVEESFLELFFNKVKSKINITLANFGIQDAVISFVEDKSLPVKKGTDILLSSVGYQIDEDLAKIIITATSSALTNTTNKSPLVRNESIDNFINNRLKHEVIVELCKVTLPTEAVMNLKIGDQIKIERNTEGKLRIKGEKDILFVGDIMKNENNHNVIKLK